MIISGFPGVGKSYAALKSGLGEGPHMFDVDSSSYSDSFPYQYIANINYFYGKYAGSHILVSSHKEVRRVLNSTCLPYIIVYPSKELREEYETRYIERGCASVARQHNFIRFVLRNWYEWIEEIERVEPNHRRICLKSGEYLSDMISGPGALIQAPDVMTDPFIQRTVDSHE